MSQLSPTKLAHQQAQCPSFDALICPAKTDDHQAQELLLTRFEPLIGKCVRQAISFLPHECYETLKAETRYLFLQLLGEFQPERGVPFEGYIKSKLERRLMNWCHVERTRNNRCAAFDESDFEDKVCSEWILNYNFISEWGGERGDFAVAR